MSGYRANAGYGVLTRTSTDKIDELPAGMTVQNALSNLNRRFGAGVTLDIDMNRNNNYLQDIGYREITSATSGLLDISFTINGAFVPEMQSWMEYLTMSEPVVIRSDSTFVPSVTQPTMGYSSNPAIEVTAMPTTNVKLGYVYKLTQAQTGYTQNHYYFAKAVQPSIVWQDLGETNTKQQGTTPIEQTTFNRYKRVFTEASTMPTTGVTVNSVYKYTGTTAGAYTEGHYYKATDVSGQTYVWQDLGDSWGDVVFTIFKYVNLDGPKYFDLGYQQINKNTTYGGNNELGVLVGCVIDSASISYESGSDAQVKFSINGLAMNSYLLPTAEMFDYNAVLDYALPCAPLVAGCVSVQDSAQGELEPIAQTDSASVTWSNNVGKLGNCLKLTYSSVDLSGLGVEMSISTYSNNPNKFVSKMYGYNAFTAETEYTIQKQPYAIPKMMVRSNNVSTVLPEPTQCIDVNLTNVYTSSARKSFSVDNAIMDEPDLRVTHAEFAVGAIPQKSA